MMPFMSEKCCKLLDLLLVIFLPDGSVSKKSACNAGDTGGFQVLILAQEDPGGEAGNPLQYFA